MRGFIWGVAAALTVGAAFAGTPERDKAWNSLIAEAKKHGGVETVAQDSASYVFQRPDGLLVTFTRMLDGRIRAVCILAKDQNLVVCGDWDTGKIRYGKRADATSPLIYSDTPPPDEAGAQGAGLLETLLSMLAPGHTARSWGQGGYWRLRSGGWSWVNRR